MKKIIIIDDDIAIQDSARLIFNPEVYEVTVFPNGKKIMSGEFETPDLFIIDKQLPGLDGLEICRHLREIQSTRDIPVIIMSAGRQASFDAMVAGASEFIEKPYSMKLMRETAEKWIT